MILAIHVMLCVRLVFVYRCCFNRAEAPARRLPAARITGLCVVRCQQRLLGGWKPACGQHSVRHKNVCLCFQDHRPSLFVGDITPIYGGKYRSDHGNIMSIMLGSARHTTERSERERMVPDFYYAHWPFETSYHISMDRADDETITITPIFVCCPSPSGLTVHRGRASQVCVGERLLSGESICICRWHDQ